MSTNTSWLESAKVVRLPDWKSVDSDKICEITRFTLNLKDVQRARN